MSWSIPTRIEEDFISGKAQYRTFQTGVGGQSILPVPTNATLLFSAMTFRQLVEGLNIFLILLHPLRLARNLFLMHQ
jgi:hypothetical protein